MQGLHVENSAKITSPTVAQQNLQADFMRRTGEWPPDALTRSLARFFFFFFSEWIKTYPRKKREFATKQTLAVTQLTFAPLENVTAMNRAWECAVIPSPHVKCPRKPGEFSFSIHLGSLLGVLNIRVIGSAVPCRSLRLWDFWAAY